MLQKEPATRPTVLYFHENAGNLGSRMDFLEEFYRRVGVNILIVAYRGYSGSEGSPSETGLKKDALAIMSYLDVESGSIDRNNVYVFGSSLGGAVAIWSLATGDYNVRALILENTFTSIEDMADIMFPWLAVFKGLILENHWESTSLIEHVEQPILFVVSEDDELVPPAMMRRLYEHAIVAKRREMHLIKGGHSGPVDDQTNAYFDQILQFIKTT